MLADYQTLFPGTLILSLSSLMAWSSRRHRAAEVRIGKAVGTD